MLLRTSKTVSGESVFHVPFSLRVFFITGFRLLFDPIKARSQISLSLHLYLRPPSPDSTVASQGKRTRKHLSGSPPPVRWSLFPHCYTRGFCCPHHMMLLGFFFPTFLISCYSICYNNYVPRLLAL